MTAEMRIVGMNGNKRGNEPYAVFVQERITGGISTGEWEQTTMSEYQFADLMRNMFPKYYQEYIESRSESPAFVFFYNYGESTEMKRRGEAFIFTR